MRLEDWFYWAYVFGGFFMTLLGAWGLSTK